MPSQRKLLIDIAGFQWWSNLGLAAFAGGIALIGIGIVISRLQLSNASVVADAAQIIFYGGLLAALGVVSLFYSKFRLNYLK